MQLSERSQHNVIQCECRPLLRYPDCRHCTNNSRFLPMPSVSYAYCYCATGCHHCKGHEHSVSVQTVVNKDELSAYCYTNSYNDMHIIEDVI